MNKKQTLPVDSFFAMKHFSDFLCEYEKSEILKYDHIYYISDMSHKITTSVETTYADEKYKYD